MFLFLLQLLWIQKLQPFWILEYSRGSPQTFKSASAEATVEIWTLYGADIFLKKPLNCGFFNSPITGEINENFNAKM